MVPTALRTDVSATPEQVSVQPQDALAVIPGTLGNAAEILL